MQPRDPGAEGIAWGQQSSLRERLALEPTLASRVSEPAAPCPGPAWTPQLPPWSPVPPCRHLRDRPQPSPAAAGACETSNPVALHLAHWAPSILCAELTGPAASEARGGGGGGGWPHPTSHLVPSPSVTCWTPPRGHSKAVASAQDAHPHLTFLVLQVTAEMSPPQRSPPSSVSLGPRPWVGRVPSGPEKSQPQQYLNSKGAHRRHPLDRHRSQFPQLLTVPAARPPVGTQRWRF